MAWAAFCFNQSLLSEAEVAEQRWGRTNTKIHQQSYYDGFINTSFRAITTTYIKNVKFFQAVFTKNKKGILCGGYVCPLSVLHHPPLW
jgi:hypothetical protein